MNYKDVFISYKSEEFEHAEWVRTKLESNGISCWMAPVSITDGSSYLVAAPDAIIKCSAFVLVLSEQAQNSKWVSREVEKAVNENKTILPFVIEKCTLNEKFSSYLSDTPFYDACKNKDEAFEKMLNEVKNLADTFKKNIPDVISDNCMDIPEILKEKEQPRKKSKKPILLGVMFAVLGLLLVAGMIYSSFNTVVIAGTEYKTNEKSLMLNNIQLTDEDIESLKKMKSLNYIKFSKCTFPNSDLSWISNAATISFEYCDLTDKHIESINFDSLDLIAFDVDGNKKITDLTVLTKVADTLTTVSFNNCSVSDISFAGKLTKVTSFYADSNEIFDISALSSCTNLQVLSINNNHITSLEVLNNCNKLTMLNAKSNNLYSIKGIENCKDISYLELSGNIISSIEYLPQFNHYNVHLDLKNNSLYYASLPEGSYSIVDLSGNCLNGVDVSAASGTTLIIGYIPSFDYGTVCGNFKNYKLVDIPSDLRDDIGEQLTEGTVVFESSEKYAQSQNKRPGK